jgi:hypothetical protein
MVKETMLNVASYVNAATALEIGGETAGLPASPAWSGRILIAAKKKFMQPESSAWHHHPAKSCSSPFRRQMLIMVTKSKLKLALSAEKGVDWQKLKQKKKQKDAERRKRKTVDGGPAEDDGNADNAEDVESETEDLKADESLDFKGLDESDEDEWEDEDELVDEAGEEEEDDDMEDQVRACARLISIRPGN